MASTRGGGNTRIPKRNRSELMEFIRLDSPDAKEILRESQRTNLIEKDTERIFRTISMCLVRNNELVRRYERRRKSLRDQGRKPKELEDRLLFAEETWQNIQKICRSGANCEKARNVLGDSQFGLHLNRNYDILLRYTACAKTDDVRFLLVFKAMFGKVKSVTPNMAKDNCTIEPTPNYDSHISVTKPDAEMGICDAQDHNLAYLYEYDEETTLPIMSPSQILPFAVISLERTAQKIIGPLRTPWPKMRNKRRVLSNPLLKHQHSEEAQHQSVYHMETQFKAMEKTDNIEAFTKNGDNTIGTDCLKNVPGSESNNNGNRKLPRRSSRKVVSERSKSLGQNDSDLQENLWDPLLEPRSSDKTNEYFETQISSQNKNEPPSDNQSETLTQNQNEQSPKSQKIKSPQGQSDSSPETQGGFTQGSSSEKSLIIQRLHEIEKEIHSKQRKLRELRQNRSSSAKSADSVTSEEDAVVDDAVSDSLSSPKVLESCDESEQPLDLSKTSTVIYERDHKEVKTMATTTDVVHMLSQSNMAVVDQDNTNQQNPPVKTVHKKVSQPQMLNNNSVVDTRPDDECTDELKLKIEICSENGNCEPNRDIPTPTLDEPLEWMDATASPLVLTEPQTCNRNKPSGVDESMEAKETSTGKKDNIHDLHLNSTGPDYDANKHGKDENIQTKKFSSFYEKYMMIKKHRIGNHFNNGNKPGVSVDVRQEDAIIKRDMTPTLLSETRSSDTNHLPIAKSSISDQQSTENKEQPNNTVGFSSEVKLPLFQNNYIPLNPRDPRVRKRSSLDKEFVNSSVPVLQMNGAEQANSENENEACVLNDNEVKRHANERDKRNSNDSSRREKGNVVGSSGKQESDSDSKHSIMACSTCDNHSSSSCGEESKPTFSKMQDDTESKSNQPPIKHDHVKDQVQLSYPQVKELSSGVEKPLQCLGITINEIRKNVTESDDNQSLFVTNSQNEGDMEVENSQRLIDNQNQQAISTIVTDRVDRQIDESTTMKTPTVIEVNYMNTQQDEKGVVHDSSSYVFNIKKEQENEPAPRLQDVDTSREKEIEASNGHNKHKSVLSVSRPDIDTCRSEQFAQTDFMPKNRGFSSYLPGAGLQSDYRIFSETLFQDVEAIKDTTCKQIEEQLQSAQSAVKKEAVEAGNEQEMPVDKNGEQTARNVTGQADTKTTSTASSDWDLSQQIDKTLAQIKNESCTLNQPKSQSKEKEKSSEKKGAEADKSKSQRTTSKKRHSSDRSRSRSESKTASAHSDSQSKQNRYRPREVSPIRDPSFVPFHQKGKILTEYFRRRNKSLGLKWFERRRSPIGFRARAIQKAKITLFKKLPAKKQMHDTRVVKIEKKDSSDNNRPSWKSEPQYKKPFIRNSVRRTSESKFPERGERSMTSRNMVRPWHRTGTAHPDNLIIDRHGMIITLDSPSKKSRSRSRSGSRSRSRPRSSSRPRNDSRTFSRLRDDSNLHRRPYARSFEERRPVVTSPAEPPTSEATLSKAMTSLLKRVLFDGPRNDGSTEGKMADMIFEMVKKKVSVDNYEKPAFDNVNFSDTRGFNDMPADISPDRMQPVRSDLLLDRSMSRERSRSRDRSRSPVRYQNSWDRREVYIDRKQPENCDDRDYFEQRRASSPDRDERENRGDRYNDRSEKRFDRIARNTSTAPFRDRFDGRGRGWSRGRGRWNSSRDHFSKPYIRNNYSIDRDKPSFQRDSDMHSSRSYASRGSRLKTGSEFSSRRNFHSFYSRPYGRKFDKYSSDMKSHSRDGIRGGNRD